MLIGINAGFGDPIAPDLPFIEQVGFQMVRQEIPFGADDVRIRLLVGEFVSQALTPLFLLAGGKMSRPDGGRVEPNEIADLGSAVINAANSLGLTEFALEIGNEPDIAHAGYSARPQDFAAAISQTRDRARAAGFSGTIITGGVSNLNQRGIAYLQGTLAPHGFAFPDDVTIGFHRYPEKAAYSDTPHDGFASRDDEMAALKQLSGAHAVGCTEFGYHTAPEKRFLFWTTRRSDDKVADSVMFDFDFFNRWDCEMAVLFQLNDGPSDTAEGRYGIRTSAGSKVVAERIEAAFGSDV
jgi:hypothetical protein